MRFRSVSPRVLLAAVLTTLAACSNDPISSDGAGAIMPLAVGNRWIGHATIHDPLTGFVTFVGYDTTEIVGTRMIGTETWHLDNHGMLYLNRAQGLYTRTENSTAEQLVARYPAQVGDTFASMRIAIVDPEGNISDGVVASRVLSKDSAATVPAGTFRCHVYRPEMIQPQSMKLLRDPTEFFRPGVGPVLRIGIGAPTDRWELVGYTIKGR